MTTPRPAPAGTPALVACLCAVATVLALAGYLRLRADQDENARRLTAFLTESENRLAKIEADRDDLAATLLALRETMENWREARARELTAATAPWPTAASPAPADNDRANGAAAGTDGEKPPFVAGEATGKVAGENTANDPIPLRGKELPGEDAGRIMLLAPRRGLVMIDHGQRNGLKQNEVLLIYRDGRFVGEAEVARPPFEDMAVCRILDAAEARIGDRLRREDPGPG